MTFKVRTSQTSAVYILVHRHTGTYVLTLLALIFSTRSWP